MELLGKALFPNNQGTLRLVGMLLIEQNDE